MTSNNGVIRGYLCSEGYIRTSSSFYSLSGLDDKFAHLTNDAIQKGGAEYGRFEAANKLTYGQFDAYLKKRCPSIKFV